MIRIPTYKEHIKGEKIKNNYLYLAALVLPFKPEDVLDGDVIVRNEENITAENYMEKSGKAPRQRNDKYVKMLKNYSINATPSVIREKFEQDELLAAKIIRRASVHLFNYLYEDADANKKMSKPPKVNRKNLRTLLVSKMDELPTEIKDIGEVKKSSKELLEYVFLYEKFSKEKEAYQILMDMDVPVCPYCNRLYTFTIWEECEQGKKVAKSKPQFEHYLPKSSYPYFAISLLNLIPSCPLCNQTKGDSDKKPLYPYSDEFGEHIIFQTKSEDNFDYWLGIEEARDKFDVEIKPDGSISDDLKDRLKNSKELFHLTELYNGHRDYIVRMYKMRYIFSDEYIESLLQEFDGMFSDKEQVKELLYLMDLDKEQWGKHSLGKLTHDIDKEITGKSPFK